MIRFTRQVLIRAALAWEWLESGVAFAPLSKRTKRDPYPMYQRLRLKDPVHRSRIANGWVLSRYEDVKTVLTDIERFSNDDRKALRGPLLTGGRVSETPSIVGLDPPEHTRLRRLVGKAFTPDAVKRHRPMIQLIANALADRIDSTHPFDVVQLYTKPLPILVMAEIMGLRQNDTERLAEWVEDVEMLLVPRAATKPIGRLRKSRDELMAYLDGIAVERRNVPGADLISDLVVAKDRGEIGNDELRVMMVFLLGAGTVTTTALLGNALFHMLSEGFGLAHLRKEPGAIPSVVEELIRFDTPVQFNRRIALQDLELGEKNIRKGDHLILVQGGAAHDPGVFSEPDRFIAGRTPADHLAFGRGIHYCLGATLARTELEVALLTLMRKFDELEVVSKPKYGDMLVVRGPTSLCLRARPTH